MVIRRLQCLKSTVIQFCIIIICLIYGEIMHPYMTLKSWRLPGVKQSEDEVRTLLIADSHIEGYRSYLHILNNIFQIDSDNFIRFYFVKAIQLTKPSGVIFLGDLLDSGNTAPDSDFAYTVSRFKKIFLFDDDLFVILTPGDNDIGGEGVPVTQVKLTRFLSNLPVKVGDYKYKFVNFYSDYKKPEVKHNILSGSFPNEINVYVSHLPVISHQFIRFPLTLLNSNASLSIHGHLHRSQVIHWKNNKDSENAQSNVTWIQTPQFPSISSQQSRFELNDSIKFLKIMEKTTLKARTKVYGELVSIGVPSCTYRSGYPQLTGIGLLQLYRNKSIIYTVLPLHNRYYTIFIYCILITPLLGLHFAAYFSTFFVKSKCWRDIFFLTTLVLLLIIIYFEVDVFIHIGKVF
ncbi:Metallophosphoesterase 1 [Schistosoma japonicum]|uniref:Metallophosphoesterase 1 n=1 Tax=Schistosoma japonicum TaxID=6182 RepID=A0A4Z2D8L9_SCHJA|nr:Metallophosphoesterase 1 [Schistosoma japonicum]TNN12786.1 Metallophosphoesterase 1 [Schistosoma japonicum]